MTLFFYFVIFLAVWMSWKDKEITMLKSVRWKWERKNKRKRIFASYVCLMISGVMSWRKSAPRIICCWHYQKCVCFSSFSYCFGCVCCYVEYLRYNWLLLIFQSWKFTVQQKQLCTFWWLIAHNFPVFFY